MRKRKNRFILFCCSFLPGAGELYLGFMNMGLSLMLAAALMAMIVGITNIGILGIMLFVLWVYSFFHANNLGALSDEEFYSLEDNYLFGLDYKEMLSLKESLSGRYRKVAAILLIIFGISMLWDVAIDCIRYIVGPDFYYQYVAQYVNTIGHDIPQVILSVVIIWCGVKLIKGKKVELDKMEEQEEKMNGKDDDAGKL